MLVARHAYLLFPGHGYMPEPLPRPSQLWIQNNREPKNSFHHSFSADQDKYVLYVSHSFPLYSRPLARQHISGEWLSACAHGQVASAPLKSDSLFDGQDHGKLLRGVAEDGHTGPFCGILVSILHDTCNPIRSDLDFVCCS